MLREVEDRLRENLSVSQHRDEIRPQLAELPDKRLVARPRRLEHRHAQAERELLHRRRLELQVAPLRLVRLRHHAHNVAIRRDGECLQRRTSDVRRAHENDAQRHEPSVTGTNATGKRGKLGRTGRRAE